MDFYSWHYSVGLKLYFKKWYFSLARISHHFSLPQLPLTLFSPWKRLIETDDTPGFNFGRSFERVTFNLVSRGIGAVVRSWLFLIGCLTLFGVSIFGIFGLVLWIVFPWVSYPYYSRDYRLTERTLKDIVHNPSLDHFCKSQLGKFFLDHLGISSKNFMSAFRGQPEYHSDFSPITLTQIINELISSKIIDEDKLRHLGIVIADLVLAAQWWDSRNYQADPLQQKLTFSVAGIGQELVYGYTPVLDKYVSDYTRPAAYASHLVGREALVGQIERTLSTGKNVVITGHPGVGKRTVAMEFARRAAGGEFGTALSYKRVLELDYDVLLSSSFDINAKKTIFTTILKEAAYAGNIILVIRDLHRLVNPSVEGVDFTDIVEGYLSGGKLPVIAVVTQTDYERFLAPLSRLRKYFQPIEVLPTTKEEAAIILLDAASVWELKTGIITTTPAIRAIVSGSDRFITEIPFPEKALELLDNVITYCQRQKITQVTVDEVNKILSEKTGVSLTTLSSRNKQILGDLENLLHKKLIGQESAISLVAKSLRARSMGIKDDRRPVGSFLFLGPTGVGKTQTAKVLAELYFGDAKNILRFDMAEFAGPEGLMRLIGSSTRETPGILTTAIKNHPASLLLLDEIEKAPPEIYNLFLTLLDEGEITDAQNRKIICRHLFVIATSNAGAEFIRQQVNAGVKNLQESVLDHIQKAHLFSPEFLNRFDGVVVYEPLSQPQLVEIAKLQLEELRDNLLQKNLHFKITPELCKRVASDGFDAVSGARPMRRVVDLTLGDAIAKELLSGKLKEGDAFSLDKEYHIQHGS